MNLELLSEIKAKTDCYLSLHGGYGVGDSVIRKAIEMGINKASVYTRMSNIVHHHSSIVGYNFASFILASSVV